MYLVVGLGNPGKKYMFTRHNIGFDAIDFLAKKNNIAVNRHKFNGLTGDLRIGGHKIVLLKPLTYMNLSGISVLEAVEYYRLDLSRLIVIYDDVDLELGQIRIRRKGSGGTHNGMGSIIYYLQSDDFPRIRLGVGRPEEGRDLAHYVLDRFAQQERERIDQSIERTAQAIETFFIEGIDKAMSMFNG